MSNPHNRSTSKLGSFAILVLVIILGSIVIFLGKGYGRTYTGSTRSVTQAATASGVNPYPISSTMPVATINAPTANPNEVLPTESVVKNPTPFPTSTADTPYNLFISAEPDDWNPEKMTKEVPMVVIGTITKIFPSLWTTPTGARPDDPWASNNIETIYTPIEFTVSDSIKGAKADMHIKLKANGGIVGKDSVTFEPDIFHEGEKVLLFLIPERRPLTYNGESLYEVYARYNITDDGKLTNFFQSFPAEKVISAVRMAAR